MATLNLLPDSTTSNEWIVDDDVSPGGDAKTSLGDTDDYTYIRTTDQNKTCVVGLDDVVGTLGTINSIRHYVRGYKFHSRSGDIEIQVIIQGASGTLYTETHALIVNGYNPQDFYGTARTTIDGSSAWTESDLDALKLNINTSPEDPDGSSAATIVRGFIEVNYTAAVTAENATFFGANF